MSEPDFGWQYAWQERPAPAENGGDRHGDRLVQTPNADKLKRARIHKKPKPNRVKSVRTRWALRRQGSIL